MKQSMRAAAVAAGLFGLSACAGAPPLQHVLLSAPQSAANELRASNWEVRRVKVPAYLDSTDIQVRTSDYVVERLPDAKWAERLPMAMTRLLQQTVDAQLPDAERDRDYRVSVTVDSFEPQPSGQVILSARWRVTTDRGDTVVASDVSRIKKALPGKKPDAAAIGRSMSAAVRELARAIVAGAG